MEDSKQKTEEEIKALKQEATLDDKWFKTLDQAIEYLQWCRLAEINVYIEYNGNFGKERLYSCDITPDSVYLQVIGLTKQEYDNCMIKIKKLSPAAAMEYENSMQIIRKSRKMRMIQDEIASIEDEMQRLGQLSQQSEKRLKELKQQKERMERM